MREIATMAWRHTSRRQSRTTLTVLGVAIGFGAIIAILSLSFGVKRSVEATLRPIASDAIVLPLAREVYDSSSVGQVGIGQGGGILSRLRASRIETVGIDQETFNEIVSTPGVASYLGRSTPIPVRAIWRDREIRMTVTAIDPEGEKPLGQIVLDSGDWPGYMEGLASQILLRLRQVSVGDRITLASEEGERYNLTISGIVGQSREARFGAPPNVPLLVTFQTAALFTNDTSYSGIVLSTSDMAEARRVADAVQSGYPNLTVLTFEDFTETIERTLNQYSLFLLSIGILAVAVAALGSANTMVVSTMERTREIGMMKATGAKNGFILKGFLLESALLGLVGGIVGVVFGYVGSRVLEYLVVRLNIGRLAGATARFSPYIPLWLIPFSIFLAVAVTLISGSYPAWRASRLDPVEAIRYE